MGPFKTLPALALCTAVSVSLVQPSTALANSAEAKNALFPDRTDNVVVPQVKAWPGRDSIKASKPDFCQGHQKSDDAIEYESKTWAQDAYSPATARISFLRSSYDHGLTDKFLSDTAKAACDFPDNAYMQKQVAAVLQTWVNLTGLNEKQAKEALKIRLNFETLEAQKTEHCEKTAPSEEATEEDKQLARAIQMATGCEGTVIEANKPTLSSALFDDIRQEPSELVRAAYLVRCLDERKENSDDLDFDNHFLITRYPVCGADVRRMNASRLDAEIKSRKLNDFARVHALETFGYAKSIGEQLTQHFTKKSQKDAAYKRFLFDAPEEAFKRVEKIYQDNKKILDPVLALEDKAANTPQKRMSSLVNSAQCKDYRKQYRDYLGKQKVNTVKEALNTMNDIVGAALLNANILCEAVEQKWVAVQYLVEEIKDKAPREHGGPRQEALLAVFDALSDILSERERFPVKPEDFSPVVGGVKESLLVKFARDVKSSNQVGISDRWEYAGVSAKDIQNPAVKEVQGIQGVIANVTRHADTATITFQRVKHVEEFSICTQTNRIDRITFSGNSAQASYAMSCRPGGTETIDTQAKPIIIPLASAEGIKAGMMMNFDVLDETFISMNRIEFMKKAPPAPHRAAFPKGVFFDTQKKKLAGYLGFYFNK